MVNKIPQIRFEGFRGEWNTNKFKDITKINQGLQIAISSRHTEKIANSYFYITNEFLKENSNVKYYIINPPESVICKEDDVLMTRTGNTGEVVTNIEGAFHNNFFKIKFDLKKINKNFFVHFLKLPKTQALILRLAGVSTIPDLNHNDFYGIKMNYSSLNEQSKIGNYFQKLDQLIEKKEKKHQKLKQFKKAMSDKMFPKNGANMPEIRFGGFSYEWEEKKLNEICSLITKGTTPLNKSSNGSVNFIKIENIDKLSGNITIKNKISKKDHENYLKRSQLKENDILFSIAGTLGRVTVIRKAVLPANTNQALAIIRIKEASLNYIATYLKGKFVSDYIKRNPTIGAQPNLSLEQIGNIEISLPKVEEQTKIGNYFKNLDKQINLQNKEIEKLKNIKRASLDKMFV